MPLYLFIDAIVDDKLHSIVISGHPSAQEITDAWDELLTQYNEGMGDNEARLFFSLHKQILSKELDLQQVDLALELLNCSGYIPQMLAYLNGVFFTTVELDPMDWEDYLHKLQVFKNMRASIRMGIDMKRIQYDAIKKKRVAGNQKPDRTYFQTMLLNLSDYAKYEVNDRITVFQFCERIRRLNKFIEQMDSKK